MICASELSGSRLRSLSGSGYELHNQIAVGGQAVTYAGICNNSGEPIAAKVYRDSADLFPESGTAESEARYLAMFRNDPNVVRLYDQGLMAVDGVQADKGVPARISALIMEKATYSLADIMEKEAISPVFPVRALRLLGQAAVALDAIHSAGVSHHDAIPSNMLVTDVPYLYDGRHPYGGRLQLCDFGVATPLYKKTGDIVLGTLTHVAPEYLLDGAAGPSVDNYAYTVMLYQACNGNQLPFDIPDKDPSGPARSQAQPWANLHATRGDYVPEFSETDAVHRKIFEVLAAALGTRPAQRPFGTATDQHSGIVQAYYRGMAAMPRTFAA